MLDIKSAIKYAFQKKNILKIITFTIVVGLYLAIDNGMAYGAGRLKINPLVRHTGVLLISLFLTTLYRLFFEMFVLRVRENVRDGINEVPSLLTFPRNIFQKAFKLWLVNFIYDLPFYILTLAVSYIYIYFSDNALHETFKHMTAGEISSIRLRDYYRILAIDNVVRFIIIGLNWLYASVIILPAVYLYQKEYRFRDAFNLRQLKQVIVIGRNNIAKYFLTVISTFMAFLIFFSIFGITFTVISFLIMNNLSHSTDISYWISLYIPIIGVVFIIFLIVYTIMIFFYQTHIQGQLFNKLKDQEL